MPKWLWKILHPKKEKDFGTGADKFVATASKENQNSLSFVEEAAAEASASAEIIASNVEISEIILLKLPVKSLLRFKSVSKQWLSLISSPRFAFLHFNPKSISGFLINRKCSICLDQIVGCHLLPLSADSCAVKPFFKPFIDIHPDLEVLHSCNGLLLCAANYEKWHHMYRSYYVYNPTLGWYAEIPCPPQSKTLHYDINHWYKMSLAFDPLKSCHYKVIYLDRYRSDYGGNRFVYAVEIYSSETGVWRLIDEPVSVDARINFCKGVFLNGVIYWPAYGSGGSLCFDMDIECLKPFSMPPTRFTPQKSLSCFGESGGHLFFIEYFNSECYVHEMEGSFLKWFKKYSVDLDSVVVNAFPALVGEGRGSDLCSILSFIHGENGSDDDALVLHIGDNVVCYNLKEKRCRKLCDLEICEHDGLLIKMEMINMVNKHIESLFSG